MLGAGDRRRAGSRPAAEAQRAHGLCTSAAASRRSRGRRSVGVPVASCSISRPSAAPSSSSASSRGRLEPAALQQLPERDQVDLGPARGDLAQRRAPGGLEQQRVGGHQRAAAGLKARRRGARRSPPRRRRAQRRRLACRRPVRPAAYVQQAGGVALGGQLERRGQQVLLGVKPVRRRGQREPGLLGDPPVGDGVGADLGDDPQDGLEQRLAARGAAGARCLRWAERAAVVATGHSGTNVPLRLVRLYRPRRRCRSGSGIARTRSASPPVAGRGVGRGPRGGHGGARRPPGAAGPRAR